MSGGDLRSRGVWEPPPPPVWAPGWCRAVPCPAGRGVRDPVAAACWPVPTLLCFSAVVLSWKCSPALLKQPSALVTDTRAALSPPAAHRHLRPRGDTAAGERGKVASQGSRGQGRVRLAMRKNVATARREAPHRRPGAVAEPSPPRRGSRVRGRCCSARHKGRCAAEGRG